MLEFLKNITQETVVWFTRILSRHLNKVTGKEYSATLYDITNVFFSSLETKTITICFFTAGRAMFCPLLPFYIYGRKIEPLFAGRREKKRLRERDDIQILKLV